MKIFKLSIALLLAVPLFIGCAANNQQGMEDGNNQTLTNQNDRNESGANNYRINNQDNQNNGNNNNNNGRMEVADKAADKVTNLDNIQRAYVMVTNRNAYVAVTLDNGQDDVSKDIEKKVSKAVKDADDNIQNVFVSANPEFVDRMRGYRDTANEGRPLAGIGEEFNEMVRRIFPTRNE
ncbi:YhcN/YlaJ family sporulation lipoprotein [Mesobacillus harenae]|uniref:YhcN/YlaJ family sporulation lipoprotein n=1 Tax=Mesobacillus harenae TaxID=2213203 RepID=UPI00157FC6B3|nr:YhcN/YlaJ family sporulation lipoprotein [Mesobacillus harenae]